MLIYIVGIAAAAGITWALSRKKAPVPSIAAASFLPVATGVSKPVSSPVHMPTDILDSLVVVVDQNGDTWHVTRDYVGPIGIGEAADLAAKLGMQLPTPALVDAIWRQADLKLLPMPRKNIVSEAVFADQRRKIEEQIAGRDFVLLGGTFKDVVVVNGFPQLYGWHVEDGKNIGIPLHKPVTAGIGKVIQPPSGKAHGIGFKDYSQGARFVRKV